MEAIIKPKEFSQIVDLIYQAKFDEAFKFIINLEKTIVDGSIKQLWALILKGRIHCYKGQYKKGIKIGKIAHQLSQKLELAHESVDALLINAHVIYLGKTEEAYVFITEAERITKTFIDESVSEYSRQQADILFLRSEICRSKYDKN